MLEYYGPIRKKGMFAIYRVGKMDGPALWLPAMTEQDEQDAYQSVVDLNKEFGRGEVEPQTDIPQAMGAVPPAKVGSERSPIINLNWSCNSEQAKQLSSEKESLGAIRSSGLVAPIKKARQSGPGKPWIEES